MTKYNIYNPYTARRVIYSGLNDGTGSRAIEILPRATAEGIELSDQIAEELMLRHEKDPENELRIEEHVEAPVDPVDDNGQQGDRNPAFEMKVDESKVEILKAEPEIPTTRSQPMSSHKKGRG